MRKSEYQKRQEGDATIFEVTPGKTAKNGCGLLIGIVFLILGTLFAVGGEGAGGFMATIGWIAILLAWFYDPRPKLHKKAMTFRVTPNSIESNGQTFIKEDIHRLILKNGMDNNTIRSSYVSVNPTIAGSITNAATAGGEEWREMASKVANSLDLEAGGKAYMLAGGMDETTAYGLLTDVCKVIGFTV